MAERDQPPPLAASLAIATYPKAKSLHWDSLRGGDLSRTWRVTFEGRSAASTAIVKWTATHKAERGYARRETHAYTEVLDRIEVRTPRLLGFSSDEGGSCLILEDLASRFQFNETRHRWAATDLECLVRAYARLHIEGAGIDRRPWMLAYQSPDWTPESVGDDVGELRLHGGWGALTGIEALAEESLEELDVLEGMSSLLHLDPDQSNVGIAATKSCQVALIDWGMAGWGAPELDLALLYSLPFGATASIERTRLLEIYWSERGRLGVSIAAEDERRSRQRVADQVLALALVAVARRSLDEQHLPGGRTERYWSAMRPALFRRLSELIGS